MFQVRTVGQEQWEVMDEGSVRVNFVVSANPDQDHHTAVMMANQMVRDMKAGKVVRVFDSEFRFVS